MRPCTCRRSAGACESMRGETSVDAGTVRSWLATAAASLRAQRDYLTQLDAAIGDADHGANMDRGFTAGEDGMRATTPLQATKGRASYLGERSIGHQDPGATSTALIIAALERSLADAE